MVFKDRVACFKAKDELLKAGTLFDDFEFLCDETADITWLRPKDISVKPTTTTFPLVLDVKTGDQGSSAFIGALATISHRKDLLMKIFPDDQSFDKDYCGIFFFNFWRFGDWEIVAIDDRLAYCTSKKELVHIKSKRPDVYFFSLLEKAYAKFKGGYDSLFKLKAGDCLVDMTGGVSQLWNLSTKNRDHWFPMLRKLVDGLLPATVNIVKKSTESNTELNSLTTYTLENVAELEFEDNRKVRLVRLGDPFGSLNRYTGAWNDNAPEWKKIPQYVRDKLLPKVGSTKLLCEFWMTYMDFARIFSTVQFCILSIEQMGPVRSGVKWALTSKRGHFPRYLPTVSNIRIPGSITYEIYPQYKIEMTDVDDYLPDGKCELVVSLLQEDHPRNIEKMRMGFTLFQMRSGKLAIPLKQGFFMETQPSGSSPIASTREITSRFRLIPGNYVLVVLTSPQFKMREFLLRMYKHQRYNV